MEGNVLAVWLLEGEELPRIRFGPSGGKETDWAGSLEVKEDGSFGPEDVSLGQQGVPFAFRLEGAGLVPETQSVFPRADETEVIHFQGTAGVDQEFIVVDEGGTLVQGAEVTVRWRDGENWNTTSADTGEDGIALVRGCRPGIVYAIGEAKGFAAGHAGPVSVPPPKREVHPIRLLRAGSIHGRCTYRGEAVKDFTVCWWPAGEVGQYSHEDFTGRDGGAFELEAVPRGAVELVAFDRLAAPSEVVRIDLGEAPEDVELVLMDSMRGTGRAIDRLTRAPIVGGSVELYSNRGDEAVRACRPAVRTQVDGSFDLEGINGLGQTFCIDAEGYARGCAWAYGTSEEVSDLGVVPMDRKQPLEVRLIAESGRDLSRFSVHSMFGADELPWTSFSEQGIAQYEAVSPGTYVLDFDFRQDGATRLVAQLDPGAEWNVVVPIPFTGVLAVRVLDVNGNPPSQKLDARIVSVLPPGPALELRRILPLTNEGIARFDGVPDGLAMLSITPPTALEVKAFRWLRLAGEDREVTIVLGGETQLFRVVDGRGDPVPGADVLILPFGQHTSFGQALHTDASGTLEALGLEENQRYVALLDHAEFTATAFASFELGSEGKRPIELKLVLDSMLEVRVEDGDELLSGVSCELWAADFPYPADYARVSDDQGRVAWGPLAAGDYEVRTYHPRCWPAVQRLTAGTPEPQVVQVRRLGNVAFEATSGGLPVPGVAIDLESAEFGVSVVGWIGVQESVVASSPDLSTDLQGKLVLEGLPQGLYTWSATGSFGETEGTVDIPPWGTANVRIGVP